MSKIVTKMLPQDKPQLALVEAKKGEPLTTHSDPPVRDAEATALPMDVVVCLDSLAVSMLDASSLVRIFRKEFRTQVGFYRSERGGSLTLQEAVEKATHILDDKRGAELYEKLLLECSESIDFNDLRELWTHSSEDAEFIWQEMKRKARVEFITGHLAATVFESVDWMSSAWQRAQFLAVRDSFIDEYEPEGGVEIALIDTMAQAYFLQLHWIQESVKRTRTDPRRHNDEYVRCQTYKGERKRHDVDPWDGGNWEIKYASELECQEQAMRMADQHSRLFQRTVRQLDNHRLSKAKHKRLSLPKVRRSVIEIEHEGANTWNSELERARAVKG